MLGAEICQNRSDGGERLQERMGSSLNQPPGIPPASPGASLLHARPARHASGKGTVPCPPASHGAPCPCLVHGGTGLGVPAQPGCSLGRCWRPWSPACPLAHGCPTRGTWRSSSASPAGASWAAERPGLVLPWVDPRRQSWPGPCSPSAGNKGPFLADEWAQCVRPPPVRPCSPRPAAAGVRGTPRAQCGGAAIQGKSMALPVLKVAFVPGIPEQGLPWGRR